MNPEEFEEEAERIKLRRRLKPHHLANLDFTVRQVKKRGSATSLDEYYLKIVGVPCAYGWFGPPKPKNSKLVQGGLFD